MRSLGRLSRVLAPGAFLVAPMLYALDQPRREFSLLGAVCLGIGLSASYVLLEQIAESCAKRGA